MQTTGSLGRVGAVVELVLGHRGNVEKNCWLAKILPSEMAGRAHPYRRDHADATPDLLSKARSSLLDDTPSGSS